MHMCTATGDDASDEPWCVVKALRGQSGLSDDILKAVV